MKRIAILASGNGTNAENIVKRFHAGSRIRIVVTLVNRPDAGAIQRMENLGVPVEYIPNSIWRNEPLKIVEILQKYDTDLVVLAGFMLKVAPEIIEAYRGRMINIHPSLLPKFGGKGMYGHHVHEAVIAAGETQSGVTVHQVAEDLDTGSIVMQDKLDIVPGETAESLEEKIHKIEYDLLPRAIVAVVEKLEAEDNDNPDHSKEPQTEVKTQTEEWAETLGLEYDPQRVVKNTPPPFQPAPPAFNISSGNSHIENRISEPMPPTYLLWSVIMTLCCCTIPGIIAIIFSAKVSSRYYAGDIDGARKASSTAEIWIIVSFVLGVLSATLYAPLSMIKQLLAS